ncbi:MAG: HPr family phosphocarrier protein [Ruminococcaceae bacterium]|nr:HPr family phosphocarrier protein [Oscillospiraceae bacterium]
MKEIKYTIKDRLGIHARPAGLLVKEALKFKSDIIVEKDKKQGDAKKIFALMSLGVKKDDTITIKINGEDEDAAKKTLENFLNQNL